MCFFVVIFPNFQNWLFIFKISLLHFTRRVGNPCHREFAFDAMDSLQWIQKDSNGDSQKRAVNWIVFQQFL